MWLCCLLLLYMQYICILLTFFYWAGSRSNSRKPDLKCCWIQSHCQVQFLGHVSLYSVIIELRIEIYYEDYLISKLPAKPCLTP
jgi:hypothetical protein